ncbi:MAG: Wadjet anti-phage system protein JetD domain-containing protein [Janthinobacterium lividum]
MSLFLEALLSSPRKRVSLNELRRHYFSLYPDVQNTPERGALLLEALKKLEAGGVISLPAAGSWEQAGSPALPLWVTLKRAPCSRVAVNHAAVTWAPELGFWPELRPSQLSALQSINNFLLRRRGSISPVPIKERSLEIFGDEKRLDNMCIGDALFAGRLPLSVIGCFRVPQPLPYRKVDAPGKPILVVENHNTYWSLAEWNEDTLRYTAVIYGGGENFRLTGRALQQTMQETGASSAEYFGDLDPKGLSIPVDFNRCVEPGYPTVSAALPLYRWLLANGVQREKPGCAAYAAGLAAAWLDAELAAELEAVWSMDMWLPQEALGTEQLHAGAIAVNTAPTGSLDR